MSKLITIVILIALLAVFGYFLALPQYNDLAKLRSQVLDKEEELHNREEYISRLRDFSGRLKDHQQAVDKVNYAFPEKADAPEVLVFLEQTASTNGLIIKEVRISTRPKEASDSLINSKIRESELNISFSGNIESLINFLIEVEQSTKLLQVDSLFFEYTEGDVESEHGIFSFDVAFKVRSWSDELAEGEEKPLLSTLEPKEIGIDFDFLSSPDLEELSIPEQILLPEEIGRENPFVPY